MLAIHGHIHEPGGSGESARRSASTPVASGILRGYLADIGRKGVEIAQRVEG